MRYAEGFLAWPLVGLSRGLALSAPALTLALALPCAVLSAGRVDDWADERALWTQARLDYPDDPLVAGKLGVTLRDEDPSTAEAALRLGAAGTSDPRLRREWSAHLAQLMMNQDRWREAVPFLRISALPDDPEASWALLARCTVEAGERLPVEVEIPALAEVCAEAIRRSPRDPDLWNAAGVEAASRADLKEAVSRFEGAVKLAPDREDLQKNLDRARALSGVSP